MTVYEQGMEIIRACRKVGPLGLTQEKITRTMALKGVGPIVTEALLDFAVSAGKVRKVGEQAEARYIATGL